MKGYNHAQFQNKIFLRVPTLRKVSEAAMAIATANQPIKAINQLRPGKRPESDVDHSPQVGWTSGGGNKVILLEGVSISAQKWVS